jgi:mono/diheme cytochrome c family protein
MNWRCRGFFLALALALAGHGRAEDVASAFQSRVQPLLQTYCTDCHGGEKPKAKIDLTGPRTAAQLSGDRDLWFRVLDQIKSGHMPPKDEEQPSPAEREIVIAWVRADLTNALLARQRAEGRSRLRRLSRGEYANTIEDLLGVRPPVTSRLPADGRVEGYDKVGSALPLSAEGAAGYLKLADVILQSVLQPQPQVPAVPRAAAVGSRQPFDPKRTIRVMAEESEQSKGHILELPDGITKVSFNTDNTSGPLLNLGEARKPGLHRVRMSVYGYQTDKPLPFGIYAGITKSYPQIIELRGVLEAPPGKAAVVEAEVYLSTGDLNDLAPYGDRIRLVPFGLGVQVPKNSLASQCRGPGLAVQWVEIEEPETPLPGARFLRADFREIFAAGGKADRETLLKAARATFARVGARLFRRDLTADEIAALAQRFTAQLDAKASPDDALRECFIDLLTTPDFLCVIEEPGRLNNFALASRLSYFLWNSTPDEALLDLARAGKLSDSRVLEIQTDRMLKDPRANRFVENFTDQWLGLRAIDDTTPDSKLYPEYARNDLLKRSSLYETRAFFQRMLQQNLSVREFVAADWTFMNEALARNYGVPGISGARLQRVTFPADSPFGGLWTQPAVLKVTANGTFTSPVKRGVWVAERLLGIPIPPPPPDIPAVEPDTRGAKTLREQLALHSSKGSCAACHAKFDPYGFALESFDVTGASRKNYRQLNPASTGKNQELNTWVDGLPVDCRGETPDGKPFADIRELRRILAENPAQLARGVTRHLVTYATGAPVTRLDQPAIESIVQSTTKDSYGLRSLVQGVVQSELFRWK